MGFIVMVTRIKCFKGPQTIEVEGGRGGVHEERGEVGKGGGSGEEGRREREREREGGREGRREREREETKRENPHFGTIQY